MLFSNKESPKPTDKHNSAIAHRDRDSLFRGQARNAILFTKKKYDLIAKCSPGQTGKSYEFQVGRLLRHIRRPTALQHNNRTLDMQQHSYIKASLLCLFLPGAVFFFFSGCMISKEDYHERPVAQMCVLKSIAFCCESCSV